MLISEFEHLYGAEVDAEVYRTVIEPMYYATNLDKADFVALLDKKAFALPQRENEAEEQMREELDIVKSDIAWYKERAKLMKEYMQREDKKSNRYAQWNEIYKAYQREIKNLKQRKDHLMFCLNLTI